MPRRSGQLLIRARARLGIKSGRGDGFKIRDLLLTHDPQIDDQFLYRDERSLAVQHVQQ